MARSVDEAFSITGDEILVFTGWFGFTALLVDGERLVHVTRRGAIWTELQRLDEESIRRLNEPWEGVESMPGRVRESKRAEWATDEDLMNRPGDFPRAEIALQLGVKTLLTFPVMIADRVVGVWLFSARERVQPDEELLELMTDVGVLLGRAVEREEAAETQRRLAQRLQTMIDSMPSGLIAVDAECRVIEWNQGAAALVKIPAARAVGRILEEVFPLPEGLQEKICLAAKNRRTMKEGPIRHESEQGVRLLEMLVYPLCDGDTPGAVIRLDDVTQRVRMEKLVVQSEKMLSVGGLAAGIAHEINNPLAGMVQNAQVVQGRMSADLPGNRAAAERHGTTMEAIRGYLEERNVLEMLDAIRSSGGRAADIVRHLIGFTRRNPSKKERCDLRNVLDQAVELSRNDYDLQKHCDFQSVEIMRAYAGDLPRVTCHSSEIHQVILCLLKNAAQAMSELKTRPQPLRILLRLEREEKHVRICVEDNGPGMNDAARQRAFEPFFTTKEPNVGTGLGLSVAYYIVTQNHHGLMSCDARPGGGTVFTIVLPIDQDVEEEGPGS
jgi:PAS domain S-box-containing protein